MLELGLDSVGNVDVFHVKLKTIKMMYMFVLCIYFTANKDTTK